MLYAGADEANSIALVQIEFEAYAPPEHEEVAICLFFRQISGFRMVGA